MKGWKGELQAKSLINNELAVKNNLYRINQKKVEEKIAEMLTRNKESWKW